MKNIYPSHVALLVPSVEKSAHFLSRFGFEIGPTETWDGEGTKEIYIERSRGNSLLLMEPVKPGAYQRAMDKRGPGLHHLAIDVLNLEGFLLSIAGSGWLLQPSSVGTMSRARTAYLARPGFPALIEVQEKNEQKESDLFVNRLELPFDESLLRLVSAIGLEETVFRTTAHASIRLGEHRIPLSALMNPSNSLAKESAGDIVDGQTRGPHQSQVQAMIIGVHHAQVSIPKGAEDEARKFYCGLLGLQEIEKPETLKGRGGFWLGLGGLQIHFGTEDGVDRRATRAHIAYEVMGLPSWKERLQREGIEAKDGIPIPGCDRFEFRDPFGNRIEFLERHGA